jgi:hypothetical protein
MAFYNLHPSIAKPRKAINNHFGWSKNIDTLKRRYQYIGTRLLEKVVLFFNIKTEHFFNIGTNGDLTRR